MLRGRRQDKFQQQTKGQSLTLVVQVTSPSLPFSPISPPSLKSQPLSLVGHIDIAPMSNFSFLSPIPPTPPILSSSSSQSTTLEIHSFYMHPLTHRTGYAQKLFAQGVKEAIHKFPECSSRMIVVTLEKNLRGRAFYTKMQGTFVGTYSGYPFGGNAHNIVCFEWLDVPTWAQKWAQLYL